MRRIPWRSLLLWSLPLLAFAWLAVAGRADSSRPAAPRDSAQLAVERAAGRLVPVARRGLQVTTVPLRIDGRTFRLYGRW